MTITKTNIVNQAMIALGGLLITDVDTDTTKRATTMKELYDIKRKYLLRKYQWKFATKRIQLTVIDNKLNFDAETVDFVVGEVVMSPPETEVELAVNGGFDADTTGWTLANGATLASVAGGKSGNCLQITCDGSDNPYAFQDITVVAGNSYKFQAYVKAGTEASYKVWIYDVTNSAYIWQSALLEETAGDWSTEIETEFIAPSGCTTVQILLLQIATAAAGTTFLYDSITFFETVQGTVEYIMREGTSGTLWLSSIDGVFVNNNTLTGNLAGSATVNGILQSVTPINDFDYIYALPSDYIQLIELNPDYLNYKLEANMILSGESSTLDIKYTYDADNPNEFDAMFTETFAALLAKEAAVILTDSSKKEKKLTEEFEIKVVDAKFSGSIEDDLEAVSADEWLTERI